MNKNLGNMRNIITMILSLIVVNLLNGQSCNNKSYNLLIGTYTTSSESDGIYVHDFDSQTGNTKFKSKIARVENPSYLDISRDGKHLYNPVKD
jgi:6-phosphogluconolactonase